MINRRKLNGQIGIAGELRVMSELLLRGFNPAKSYLDHGIDIILDNGKRIQVKTARRFSRKDRKSHSTYYHFVTRPWDYQRRTKGRERMSEVDIVICWCIEDNTYYVIPAHELKERQGFELFPGSVNSRSKYEQYRENWETI